MSTVLVPGDGLWSGWLVIQRVLDGPDCYLTEIGRRHPDIRAIDLGTNDLTCADHTVADVADHAMRFLALVDNDVHPNMIVFLFVIQITSVGNRSGMTVSTFNHRLKTFNSRIAACVRQLTSVPLVAKSRVHFPRYTSADECHLKYEGQARYA